MEKEDFGRLRQKNHFFRRAYEDRKRKFLTSKNAMREVSVEAKHRAKVLLGDLECGKVAKSNLIKSILLPIVAGEVRRLKK